MNSNRNDRNSRYESVNRESKFSYPKAGYNRGFGSSQREPYSYDEAAFAHDRGEPGSYIDDNPGRLYGTHGGEYPDYEPGYSTANDFSTHQSPFSRSTRSGRGDNRGYSPEDFPRYREMYKRSEYPETYRSAESGYMSEHVGSDSGRRDYNPNIDKGNLYGTKYGLQQSGGSRDYWQGDERGYMSEDDYDRGSPLFNERTSDRNLYSRRNAEAWLHQGKGPRNYKRSDNRILEDINDRLTDDAFVDASEVDVSVQDGEVTLTGTVDSRDTKRRAEDIAESVPGVTQIENRIKVRSATDLHQPPLATPY